jgi:hypothetical protein
MAKPDDRGGSVARFRSGAFVALVLVAVATACGGSDGSSDAPDTSASTPNTTTSIADSGDSTAGASTLSLGDQEYDLDVQTCSLGPGGGAVGVTALTTDGDYEFTAAGIAGAVTITLRGVGNPDVWTATGATPTVGASTFGYSGTVSGSSGDEQLAVSIRC